MRRTPLPGRPVSSPGGRHWKMALCSLSIGMSVAPPERADSISSGPATTSDSLFASSTRLPERAAASVDGSPAAPTMAAMTASTSGPEAQSLSASGPQRTSTGEPATRKAASRRPAASGDCSTAIRGRCRRHCSSRRSSLVAAASATTSKRSGWRPSTSSVLTPMLPVLPNTATRITRPLRAGTARAGTPAPRRSRCRAGRARRRAPAAANCCPSLRRGV